MAKPKKELISKPSASSPAEHEAAADLSRQRMRLFWLGLFVILACFSAGSKFLELRKAAPIYPSPALTDSKKLSAWLPSLKGTRGDADVLIFDSHQPGGTLLVLGGTHPNEPAANLSAVVLAENLSVQAGKALIIPRANSSAFAATEPQEAFPQEYAYTSRQGRIRRFQIGSRYSFALDGWPDPIVYRHHPSGQLLSGPETRNLNRAYPGRADGSLTEMIAFAITELVKKESVDLFIDLHEAAPEYPVINAVVAHQRAVDMAAVATVELQVRGVEIALEVSPENFHGLSHREVGDFSSANAFLFETAGALQGRLRGPTSADLVTKSVDPLYAKAYKLGKTATPFPEEGLPMEVRAGRHLESISVLASVWTEFNADSPILFSGIPGLEDLKAKGVGFYLK